MSFVDRPALAAALRVATPEMLREMAENFVTWPEVRSMTKEGENACRVAAALALAVAEMQEREDVTLHKWGTIVGLECNEKPVDVDTIPAALAALIEGAA